MKLLEKKEIIIIFIIELYLCQYSLCGSFSQSQVKVWYDIASNK